MPRPRPLRPSEVPEAADGFIIGYLAGRHPDLVREAIAAWRAVEAEAKQRRAAR